MVVSLIIGIIILAVIIFTIIRVVKNILVGIILVFVVIFVAYIIFGSVPDLRDTPIIGPYLPKTPLSLLEFLSTLKKYLYDIEIINTSRDSENKLLITIKNTGRFRISRFKVFVDDKSVEIINIPMDPLNPGKTTVIQTNWKEDYKKIQVKASSADATFFK